MKKEQQLNTEREEIITLIDEITNGKFNTFSLKLKGKFSTGRGTETDIKNPLPIIDKSPIYNYPHHFDTRALTSLHDQFPQIFPIEYSKEILGMDLDIDRHNQLIRHELRELIKSGKFDREITHPKTGKNLLLKFTWIDRPGTENRYTRPNLEPKQETTPRPKKEKISL